MHPFINIAIQSARKASRIMLQSFDRLDDLHITEKSKNDFVTDIDKQSEQVIIETIRKSYPNHGILAEESEAQEGDQYTWIIDPLDGTTNYIHGMPHFCISIAVKDQKEMIAGVIFDPIKNELFMAAKGEGAQLDNRKIRVSSCKKMDGALLCTGFPFRNKECMPAYFKTLENIFSEAGDIRRTGSAALDLAYVAAGRFDGFWEMTLKPWDMAAGSLLILEAGGFISDFKGEKNFLENGNVIAGNPKIYEALLNAVGKSEK